MRSLRPVTRSLLVIVLAFAFDAVAFNTSPVPPALAQCAPDPSQPDRPCCDQAIGDAAQSRCLGQPIGSGGNEPGDEPWILVGVFLALGFFVFVALRSARRILRMRNLT